MGGRAAEQVTCGRLSTGASDDLKSASSLAYQAVSVYGLSPRVGPLNVAMMSQSSQDGFFPTNGSSVLQELVQSEVKALCDAALRCATDVVSANLAYVPISVFLFSRYRHSVLPF